MVASAGLSLAQSSIFELIRPDVIVVVQKHRLGADLVEINMVAPDYPKELLERQVIKLCSLLGSDARGLLVTTSTIQAPAAGKVTKATFATDGIIDHEKGLIRIEPFAKAFAGAASPFTVKGINIMLDGEAPTTSTVQRYGIDQVIAGEARYNQSPRSIEYRIQLLSQDDKKLKFPDRYEAPNKPATEKPSSTGNRTAVVLGLFIVGSLALGTLVYLLVLRGGTRPSSKKR